MLHHQLGNHFGDDVVQIGTMCHRIHQRCVLVAQFAPIVAVHVGDVEEVAVTTPHLGKYLMPLLRRHAAGGQPGQRYRFRLLALAHLVVFELLGGELRQHVFAVRRQRPAGHVVDHLFCLALLDRVGYDRGLLRSVAAVIKAAAALINEIVVADPQVAQVVGLERHANDAFDDAVEVDLQRFARGLVLVGALLVVTGSSSRTPYGLLTPGRSATAKIPICRSVAKSNSTVLISG